MILGDVCTRRCGFCNVQTGVPTWNDPLEPLRDFKPVKKMGLRHAVVTSVDRDDLPDYGAGAFVGVIRSIRMLAPECKVEVVTPDFRGQEMPLAKVVHERPDVFNHNVETVPRLYPRARRGSDFMRSARVLRMAGEMGGADVVTKSGLMVGLGEEFEEMVDAFAILRDHGVQILTVGQYLRPTEKHLPVVRYWPDRRVRRAARGGLRARLRVGRGRAARAQLLPRRRVGPRSGRTPRGLTRPAGLATVEGRLDPRGTGRRVAVLERKRGTARALGTQQVEPNPRFLRRSESNRGDPKHHVRRVDLRRPSRRRRITSRCMPP